MVKVNKENKVLIFDMDGTIADLYGQPNWLEDLRNFNPAPYQNAEPLVDMTVLSAICSMAKMFGWKIVVTSWLSKESCPMYDALVRQAKIEWLDRYSFPYDEIHLVKYGTTKANCTRHYGGYQVLVDDNEKVRNGYLELQKQEPDRIKLINANNFIDNVYEDTKQVIIQLLQEKLEA